MIFVTAGIASPHYMSTWPSSRNIEDKVFDGDALQKLQAIFEKVCRDFQAQLVEMNGEAEHVHLLSHYAPKHSVSSLVNSLKGVPVAYSVSNAQIWRNAIGTMSCGRLPTSPPVVAGQRWALLSNTSSNKRPHSNGPYIPGLKIRGLTARVVTRPKSIVPSAIQSRAR